MTKRTKNTGENNILGLTQAFFDHKKVLAAYIARFFLRPEDVEDILQDSFIQVFEAANKREVKSPKAYLFITARNQIYRHLRHKSRDIAKEIGEIDESFLDSGEVPADLQLHHKRKMAVFMEATKSLPAQCRRVFLMRKLYGMSHKEIAKTLDISTSTVERHVSNAIKRCRIVMDKRGYSVDYNDRPVRLSRVAEDGDE